MPFLDRFNQLDSRFWSVTGNSAEATAAVAGGAVGINVPADAQPLPGQDFVSAGLYSRCTLVGDFDAQVDYSLPAWPAANDVNVNFSVADRTLFRHNRPGADGVSSYFPPSSSGSFASDDLASGAFRLVRKTGTVRGYYHSAYGEWLPLGAATMTRDPVHVSFSVFTNRSTAGAEDVQAAFDNFRITHGRIDCS